MHVFLLKIIKYNFLGGYFIKLVTPFLTNDKSKHLQNTYN